jgi:LysM repeat protein
LIVYVVQPGDSLYILARRFETTIDAIRRANYIPDPGRICPGQIIGVPVCHPEPIPPFMLPPPERREILYKIQRSDTLTVIARRFGSSVNAILRRNRLRDPNKIYPGQIIIVPAVDDPHYDYY